MDVNSSSRNGRMMSLPFAAIAITTLLTLGISVYCLFSGWYIIFQNLLYIPIIIACVYFTKKGLVFSIGLALLYFLLISVFTRDSGVVLQALMRVIIFAVVAGVVTYLSIKRLRMETDLRQYRENLEDLVMERTAVLRKTVEEIEQLRQNIEFILGATKTGLGIIDPDLNIRYIDPEWQKVYGDPKGRKCHEYFMGRSEVCDNCGVLKALATRQVIVSEKIMPKEGNRLTQVTTIPFQDVNGRWMVAEVNVDITELKRAGDAVKNSELRYRTLFDRAVDGIMILSMDGEKLFVNESFAKMHGYDSPKEMEHLRLEDLDTPETAKLAPERLRRLRAGEVLSFEVDHHHKYGHTVPLMVTSNVIQLEGESYFLAFHRDISERKRAEEALRESDTKYRGLFAEIGYGFALHEMVFDEDGNPSDYTTLEVNPAFENILGVKKEGVIGVNASSFLPKAELERWVKVFGDVVLTGKPTHYEMYSSSSNGKYFRGYAYSSKGGQFAVIFEDVTEYKNMVEQLMHSQKMEAIGSLAGGIAHDFNNMLSIILGYGESINGKLGHKDPLREDVGEILKAGKRSAALTRQLLAFSRKQTLQPEVVDLNALLANIEKMLRRLIGEDIDLRLVAARDLACVKVDPGQIEQVIMNLAVNARDAMPKGGKLTVETSNVELDGSHALAHAETSPGKCVMIAVTDTGCGMDEATLSRIFEPFFTTKDQGKGTGLGLSTVYGIIRQSGGNITVTSEQGKGTTFKIVLPCTDSVPEVKEVQIERKEVSGSGRNILLVEDESALRGLFHSVLTRRGYQVAVAANGSKALLLVENEGLRPDLVITDVVMPEISGPVLMERLRKIQPGLKAIYISGYMDSVTGLHGELGPETPFLKKPFSLRDLVAKIEQVTRDKDR